MRPESALLNADAARPFAGQRVLVTGASGFLGWQVARQGLAAGVETHTLGRHHGPHGSTFHRADLTDLAAVSAVVAEVRPDAVIHCAAPGVAYGSQAFAEMLAVAKGGARSLYTACAALPEPPQVAHLGSGFEYAASSVPVSEDWPLTPAPESYGAAKASASRVAHDFADRMPIALLRPFHIYGAGEAARRLGPFVIAEARKGDAIPLTGCAQQRDFLHVDDCAAMVWDALARLPREPELTVRNLGSGQPIALRQFIQTLVAELASAGIIADCQFGALPYREGEPMISLPDLSRWNADGARPARISLGAGIADLVAKELTRCA